MSAGSSPLPSGAPVRTGSRFGSGLALVAVALAVVLASAPVREPEIWSHLARGRAVAEGRPHPARDDGLLSPPNARGAHVSVLYDLPLYAGFRFLGGAGAAALNAGAAALLAFVVFRTGRTPGRSAPAGACALVTVLCVGPWLELGPRVASYLFLALTMLLLRSAALRAESGAGGTGLARWQVLVLFAVWANVDRWVVVGPVTIGLMALVAWRGRTPAARVLGELFLIGLGASLLSPNHWTVWTPAHTVGWEGAGPSASPFWPAWYRTGSPIVGAGYAGLVLLGLFAFWRDRGARAWAPVWFLLLVGAARWPVVAPLFAVVAGPTAALGLASAQLPALPGAGRRWGKAVRFTGWVFVLAGAGALLAVGWTGWATGRPLGRPVWSVDTDDSLRDAVLVIERWRREGALGPNENGVALSPEVADYRSWFGEGGAQGTGEQSGALDFATVRAGLLPEGDGEPGAAGWREVFRKRGISYLILHSGGAVPTERVVTRLAGAPDEWTLLYLRGRTVVFGWQDPAARGAGDRFAPLRLSPERRAFSPALSDTAPLGGADREPGARAWARAFAAPNPGAPQEQDEAALYLAYFDGQRGTYDAQNRATWLASQSASLLGNLAAPAPGPGPGAADIGQWIFGVPGAWNAFLAGRDDGSLGAPVLAVRSARRAVRENPDDARSYFLLGEAYLRLAQATRERTWRYLLPAFDRIRQVQAITAFQKVLILRPDSAAAHGRLARLYRDRGSLDLALHHLDGLIKATRARGPQPGETPEGARQALAALEREYEGLGTEVRRREALCESGAGRRALDQAREAAGAGLPDRALKLLLKSDASEFGPEGAKLELDLLLWAGRGNDIRAWLDPELEKSVGAATYHEILACLAAVTGDYRDTGPEMRNVAGALLRVPSRLPTPHAQASYDVGRALLSTPFVSGTPSTFVHNALVREGLYEEVHQITTSLRREANAHVVGGLLAMEAGQIEEAEAFFKLALVAWGARDGRGGGSGLDFSGRRVAQDCLRLIREHRTDG